MYSLTIIGGGAMSCGYDNPDDKSILTHTNGALQHPLINLESIIEIDKSRQKYIVSKWGESFNIYSNIRESISEYKSDIFIIATPTVTHLKIIKELLLIHSPKLIICEKPTVSNLKEFEILNILLKQSTTKIMTNFIRRFDPSLNKLKNIIAKADNIYHFYGTFTKGLMHNGSHMIDLVSMLIGHINSIGSINKKIIKNDIFGEFIIKTAYCNGVISNIYSNSLSVFELIIYTDIAKVSILGGSKEIIINYIDKSNSEFSFETYSLKEELPHTLKKNALNSIEYAIQLIEDDYEYRQFEVQQYNVNKLIFDTQKKLME